MSSSDDDEWEREQMLRGCQSRQKYSKQGVTHPNPSTNSNKNQSSGPLVIDVSFAKQHLTNDNQRLTMKLEEMKRSVGGLKRDIAERENRKNSLKRMIEQLKADRANALVGHKITDSSDKY